MRIKSLPPRPCPRRPFVSLPAASAGLGAIKPAASRARSTARGTGTGHTWPYPVHLHPPRPAPPSPKPGSRPGPLRTRLRGSEGGVSPPQGHPDLFEKGRRYARYLKQIKNWIYFYIPWLAMVISMIPGSTRVNSVDTILLQITLMRPYCRGTIIS